MLQGAKKCIHKFLNGLKPDLADLVLREAELTSPVLMLAVPSRGIDPVQSYSLPTCLWEQLSRTIRSFLQGPIDSDFSIV